MIYLENLSNEEKKAIQELHTRIINDLPKDMLPLLEEYALLCRFLKARNFDVDKAEKMLRNHITWRKHFQIATFLEDFRPRPFFGKYISPSYFGLDKKGNILAYLPLGVMDGKDIMKCVQINEYVKHWIYEFEKNAMTVRSYSRKNPGKSVQFTTIYNCDKLTFANASNKSSIEQCVRLVSILQDNYPESLSTMYVINTPAYFVIAYSVLKSLMSNTLRQKIHIYGNSGWQEKLLEVIDADVLPAFLGGNRTDPDGNPMCTAVINHSGVIHESYYLAEEDRDFSNKSLVKRITVHSKQKHEIPIHVAEAGYWIHWEFFIKNKDIGFGIFYKVSEFEIKEILPLEKYDTTDGVEKGSYKTQSKGNYIIIFDNSYSWMSPKEVDYSITVFTSAS